MQAEGCYEPIGQVYRTFDFAAVLFATEKEIKLKMIQTGNRTVIFIIKAFIMLFLLGTALMPYTECKAASAAITLSTDKSSFTVGDEISVSVKLSSEAILGDFEAFVSYNDDVLEFKKSGSHIAGGDGLIKISDKNVGTEENSRKYILNFTAKKTGNSTISLKDNPEIYDYESGLDMSVSSNELNISIEAPKTASTNTNLKSLKINPGTLKPEFNRKVTEYSAQAGSDIKQMIISAVAEDEAATVAVKGNDALKPGSNKVIVTVTSESGSKKQYVIEVIREEEESGNSLEETSGEETSDDTETGEEYTLENKDARINEILTVKDGETVYIQNGFRYQILPVPDESRIPAGFVGTTVLIDDTMINAYMPKSNPDSDFLLLYAVNESGEEGFYQYDRVEGTMQRYSRGQGEAADNRYVMTEEIIRSDKYKSRLTNMGIVIAVLGAILIMLSIALIHVYMKSKDSKE